MIHRLQTLCLLILLTSTALQSQNTTISEPDLKVFEQFDELESYLSENENMLFIINFWATWCKPCVAELPYFEQLQKEIASENTKVLLVSLDFKRHIKRKLIPFIQKNNLASDLAILTDAKPNSWIDRVDPSWSGAIPATVIFKKDKKAFVEQDFHSYEELYEFVSPYLSTTNEKSQNSSYK